MVDKKTPVIAPEPEVPALKIIGEVRALHVSSPHDVIVINVDFPIGDGSVQQVIQMWKESSCLPNPVVCLIKGVSVDVVKPGSQA